MKPIIYVIYIWCTLVVLAGCFNGPTESTDSTELGSIPEKTYLRLLAECDYVDIIFYDSQVSMAQDDAAGIQGTLTFINKQVAKPSSDCKPKGHIMYQINGDIIAEGDFYCSEGCTYIIFTEDNKPKYANVLSSSGIQFFQNILLQIQNRVGGQ